MEPRLLKMAFFTAISAAAFLSCGSAKEDKTADKNVPEVQTRQPVSSDLESFMPRNEELVDFEKVSSDRILETADLLEAGGYSLQSGIAADFRAKASDAQFQVEIGEAAGEAEAFGLYADLRPNRKSIVAVGAQGFLGEGYLIFLKGRYVVRINGYQSSEISDSAAITLADIVDHKIDVPASLPAAVIIMPEEAKIENSERYIASGFIGHDFFSPAYTCDYRVADSVSTLFLIPRGSEAEILQYKVSLENRGLWTHGGEIEGHRTYFFDDPEQGRVIMSDGSGRLAGIINTPDRDQGLALINALWSNLAQ